MFHLFPKLPAEIRAQIWNICILEYPARIIDLNYTKNKTGFESRASAPTILHICQESRSISQELYTQAFGNTEIPAKTWINFNKDILYLPWKFCEEMIKGFPSPWDLEDGKYSSWKGHQYYKEINQDMIKAKDLAIGGIWNPGSKDIITCRKDFLYTFQRIGVALTNVERVTFVDTQYISDSYFDLDFLNTSLGPVIDVEDEDYLEMTNYRKHIFREFYYQFNDIWRGLEPWPWFEFGTLVERQSININPTTRPRTSGSRLATEEDRIFAHPDLSTREWLWSDPPEILGIDRYRNEQLNRESALLF